MHYISFNLTIQDQTGNSGRLSLDITVQCKALKIEDQRTVPSPFSESELDGFTTRIERISRKAYDSNDCNALKVIGEKIYLCIFKSPWNGYLVRAWHAIRESNDQLKGLKISVYAQGTVAELIPWELLYDPSANNFLSCSERSVIVRSVDNTHSHDELPSLEPPVRVLLVGASPISRSTVHAGVELDKIQKCLKKLTPTQATIRKRPTASWGRFRDSVSEFNPHILHLVAHGSEDGVVFHTTDTLATTVDCDTLYNFLGDVQNLRLVILNVCTSEHIIKKQFMMHSQGIPSANGIWSILVTRATISCDTSYEFSQNLYTALAAGKSITQAVGGTRNYLQGMELPQKLEWSTHMLYEARNVIPFPPLSAIREIVGNDFLSQEQIHCIAENKRSLSFIVDYLTDTIEILDNPDQLEISVLKLIVDEPKQEYVEILIQVLNELRGIRNCPTYLIRSVNRACSLINEAMETLEEFSIEIRELSSLAFAKKKALQLNNCLSEVQTCFNDFFN